MTIFPFLFWSLPVFVRIKGFFADLTVEYKSGTCCLLLVLKVVASLLLHGAAPTHYVGEPALARGCFLLVLVCRLKLSLEDFELF